MNFIDDIVDSLADTVGIFLEFLPRLVGALILYFIGKIVAGIVVKLAHKFLKAIKFDAVIDKSGLGAVVERGGFPDSALLLAKIVGWIIMLVFIQLAVSALGIESIESLINQLVAWIPNVLIAIVLIVITGAAANFVRGVLTPTMANITAGDTLLKVIIGAIWVFGSFAAIDQLGFGADIIDQLWTALTTGLAAILVIKFGIGGIWAARDRFWPRVYDALDGGKSPQA